MSALLIFHCSKTEQKDHSVPGIEQCQGFPAHECSLTHTNLTRMSTDFSDSQPQFGQLQRRSERASLRLRSLHTGWAQKPRGSNRAQQIGTNLTSPETCPPRTHLPFHSGCSWPRTSPESAVRAVQGGNRRVAGSSRRSIHVA